MDVLTHATLNDGLKQRPGESERAHIRRVLSVYHARRCTVNDVRGALGFMPMRFIERWEWIAVEFASGQDLR